MASSQLERPRHEIRDPIVHTSSHSFWTDSRNRVFAATAGTIIADTLIAPTNVIKQKQLEFLRNQANKTALPSMWQIATSVINEKGYGSLFHGHSSNLFKQIGYKSLVLLCYDPLRNQLSNMKAKLMPQPSKISKLKDKVENAAIASQYIAPPKTISMCLLAGGVSGIIGYSIIHPQEALTSSVPIKTNAMRYLSRPNLMYVFLIYATEFGGYDYLKSYILNYSTMASRYTIWPVYILSATTVGIISALISVPGDILRARAMNTVKTNDGMISHVLNKISKEGKHAFRRQLMLNMTRKVVWLSGFFLTYEEIRHYLDINYSNSQIMYQ